MANEEHLGILRLGVENWNQWREDNPEVRPDLRRADLVRADLRGANLRWATFSGADLSSADLRVADLRGAWLFETQLGFANLGNANLSGVDLTGAILYRATLSGAVLREARLFEADLGMADLSQADLSQAELHKAHLDEADFSGANLYKADLFGSYVFGAYLGGANLRGADLSQTDFRKAKLITADLREANFSGANLIEADLSRTDLRGANLSEANLVRTKLEYARLENCMVHGASVWNVNLTGTIQKDLIITRKYEPIIMVDDLEVAQFIYLLLNHDKLRNVLNAVTARGVLLLGRFSEGGLDTLKAMGEGLRELGYTPIIFDFDRPTGHDYTETVKTLVGLSRFVIVELSGPSVPYELGYTVFGFERPFTLILEKGHEPFFMSRDLAKYPWVLQPVIKFESKKDLLDLLPEHIVAPAENYIEERQQRLRTRDSH